MGGLWVAGFDWFVCCVCVVWCDIMCLIFCVGLSVWSCLRVWFLSALSLDFGLLGHSAGGFGFGGFCFCRLIWCVV